MRIYQVTFFSIDSNSFLFLGAAIIGIVIGAIVGLCVTGFCLFSCVKKRADTESVLLDPREAYSPPIIV